MSEARVSAAAYERAERMLGHHRNRLALRARVVPHWIDKGERFWYRVGTERGVEFFLVDPTAASRGAAFDHERLAQSLARASGAQIDPYDLPFDLIEFTEEGIAFDTEGGRWTCRLPDHSCRRDDGIRPHQPSGVASPDGRWTAFRKGHDLWLRSARSGDEIALTTDGTADRPYATHPEHAGNRRLLSMLGIFEPPTIVLWSPDSSRLLAHRNDERGVPLLHLIESAPADQMRPRLHSYRYAMPGETMARGEWVIFDVGSGASVRAESPPFQLSYQSPIRYEKAWWSPDGSHAYHLDQSRDGRTLWLKSIDAASGEVATLIAETGDTRVEAAQEMLQKPMVRVLSAGDEALWYSQRDGRGHLYLYNLSTGRPVRQVTDGAYGVQEILYVDETDRVAYLAVSGLVPSDPYLRSPVRVSLDGGGFRRLTDDDLDHVVVAPEHGRWFVDSASTVETPPHVTVRDRDGSVMVELERADISRLVEAGWSPPERIRVTSADGETPIYGVLYKPHGFDPGQRYPVVDHVYPGPHMRRVQPSFDPGWYGHDAEALAALGFAVIAVDGRGTPGRDKGFHDYAHKNLEWGGSPDDHVAALHQLAETRPWMDLARAGIVGYSAGGFTAAHALMTYPDIYKVGVAESGTHDYRYYHGFWAEIYDGPFVPDASARLSNAELAENLNGHLLLIHGEMDDNVTPHLTMRLVDRLIAANKDFDLLIVPGADHSYFGYAHYVIRKRWDYLVRHLMHREPPKYRLADVPLPPGLREVILG